MSNEEAVWAAASAPSYLFVKEERALRTDPGPDAPQGPLMPDFVAKVENQTTLKISRKLIFGLRWVVSLVVV